MFGEIFVGNFVENGRKPTKFPTKFWKKGFLGQALARFRHLTPAVTTRA
jgi:hypothetical protein